MGVGDAGLCFRAACACPSPACVHSSPESRKDVRVHAGDAHASRGHAPTRLQK